MGLSELLGDAVGIPDLTARFLLALFSAYLFSFVFRAVLKDQHAQTKSFFFSISGVWMVYYIFGIKIWHSALDITLVYVVLLLWGGTLLSVTLTWIITMGHLVLGYIWIQVLNDTAHKANSIEWTMPHCVLVLKLIGLSFNLYDGKKKPESLSEDLKKNSLQSVPSLVDVVGFCYFYGSVLIGPQMTFRRYHDFIKGRLFDWNKTPSSVGPGVLRMLLGVFFLAVYNLANQHYPYSILFSEGYAEENLLKKLILVFVCGKISFWKYISVWLISEGSCVITGLSYSGMDSEGKVTWDALTNIHVFDFETCINFQGSRGVVESFNINTNQWVGWYVFKRLKWMNNKMMSMVFTLLFLCVWHGVRPGYYVCFSLEFFLIICESTIMPTARYVFGSSLSEMNLFTRIPLTIFAFIGKNLLLYYAMLMFVLLSWTKCYQFMKAVYFYGHVLCIVWLPFYYLVLNNYLRRAKKKEEKLQ